MAKVSRRQLLIAAAPAVAATPLIGLATRGGDATAASAPHAGHEPVGHAAMIGPSVPAPDGPGALDALLYPPEALPYEPGRVREYHLSAIDREIEVIDGVIFPAWTYNGTVPGPVIRATEGDLLRVHLANADSHPHTIHFHGIH